LPDSPRRGRHVVDIDVGEIDHPGSAPSRTRPRGSRSISNAPLRTEDLAAHVVAVATVAGEIDRGQRSPVHLQHGDEVVDVTDLRQRLVDDRRGVSTNANDTPTTEPLGEVVFVHATVDRQAAAHRRIAEGRGGGSASHCENRM
jgi:hypothetical protein